MSPVVVSIKKEVAPSVRSMLGDDSESQAPWRRLPGRATQT